MIEALAKLVACNIHFLAEEVRMEDLVLDLPP